MPADPDEPNFRPVTKTVLQTDEHQGIIKTTQQFGLQNGLPHPNTTSGRQAFLQNVAMGNDLAQEFIDNPDMGDGGGGIDYTETINELWETINGLGETINGLGETINGLGETINGLGETINELWETIAGLEGRLATVEGAYITADDIPAPPPAPDLSLYALKADFSTADVHVVLEGELVAKTAVFMEMAP